MNNYDLSSLKFNNEVKKIGFTTLNNYILLFSSN